MKKKGQGWTGESQRHRMSAYGIKTSPMKIKASGKYSKDHFKTGKSLEAYLETREGEEYLEEYWSDLFEVPFGDYAESEGIPYWVDHYEDYLDGFKNLSPEGDEIIESVIGMHEPLGYGEIETINGKDYYYLSGLSGQDELELQANNDELIYWGVGYNFFRIWKPVPDTYITVNDSKGDIYLTHKGKHIFESDFTQSVRDYAKKKGYDIQDNLIFNENENKFEKWSGD